MQNEEKDIKWIEEYPTLKQVNPVNAFTVPQNYFVEMEEQVMATIRLHKLQQPLANEGFTVPADYFDELTQNIESRVAIEQVLTNEQAFKVPESYFDDLTQNIQARIAIDKALNAEKAFEVPENYFEELSGNIQARIAVEEALNTETSFIVPDGYFADLESRILQQTTEVPVKPSDKQREGVIVKLLVSKVFKYASAACFALVVGAAIFMSEFNNPVAVHNRSYVHKVVSKIPDDDLELYLQLNNDNSAIIENINPDDLNIGVTDTKSN